MATWIVLVAFFLSCGGHWAALQAVAWARMVVDFSASTTLPQAIVMTVSGQYPCSLCKKIAQKHREDAASGLKQSELKKDFCAEKTAHVEQPVASALQYRSADWSAPARREPPLLPPPLVHV